MTTQLGAGFEQMQADPSLADDTLFASKPAQRSPEMFTGFLTESGAAALSVLSRLSHDDPAQAVEILRGAGCLEAADLKPLWTEINDAARLEFAVRKEPFGLKSSNVDALIAHEPADGLGQLVKGAVDYLLCQIVEPEAPEEITSMSAIKNKKRIVVPKRLTIGDVQKTLKMLGFTLRKSRGGTPHETWVSPHGKTIFKLPQHGPGRDLATGYVSQLRRVVEQFEGI